MGFKTITVLAALLALGTITGHARASDTQGVPNAPYEIADWVQTEMTCLEYLALRDDGDASTLTNHEMANLLAMVYMTGAARAHNQSPQELMLRATLNCARNKDVAFGKVAVMEK